MTPTTAYDSELANGYIAATETDFRRTFIGHTFHSPGPCEGPARSRPGVRRWPQRRPRPRIDSSDEMIRRARQRSINDPGLELRLAGVEKWATAASSTASSRSACPTTRTVNELAVMWKRAYKHVTPGGGFVAVMVDSRYDSDLSKYGIISTCDQPRSDGVDQAFVDGDREVASAAYRHWERDTHQRLAVEAGFINVTWVPLYAERQR